LAGAARTIQNLLFVSPRTGEQPWYASQILDDGYIGIRDGKAVARNQVIRWKI